MKTLLETLKKQNYVFAGNIKKAEKYKLYFNHIIDYVYVLLPDTRPKTFYMEYIKKFKDIYGPGEIYRFSELWDKHVEERDDSTGLLVHPLDVRGPKVKFYGLSFDRMDDSTRKKINNGDIEYIGELDSLDNLTPDYWTSQGWDV